MGAASFVRLQPASGRVSMSCASQTLLRSPASCSQNKSRPLQLQPDQRALKGTQSLHTGPANRLPAPSRHLFTNHSCFFVQVEPLNAHEPILNFSTSLESQESFSPSAAHSVWKEGGPATSSFAGRHSGDMQGPWALPRWPQLWPLLLLSAAQ